jgi:molybdopterin synthase catalytic subunit
MTVASVTTGPIDVGTLLAEVADVGRGATVLFLGSVRRTDEDGPVGAIEYSAYDEMVGVELERILNEAARRWPGLGCVVQHRTGRVPVGEASIAIAAAAAHRGEAFEACRFVVDEAKRRLPVWKHEQLDDGTARWREG